jgi:glycosyltransferase involved in cell wall biosynthesis
MRQRIAFVAHDGGGELGGVATWIADLAPWLVRHGVEARVYGFDRGGPTPLFDHLEHAGVPVYRMPHSKGIRARTRWLSARYIEDCIDIVMPNYFLSAFTAVRWCGERRPKVIGVLHSDDSLYRRLLDEIAKQSPVFPCDALVAVSAYLERLAAQKLGDSIQFERICYGIPHSHTRATAPRGEVLRIVYTGRMTQQQKRILDTVSGACEAVTRTSGIFFDFIGEGSERRACEQMVAARGCSDRIRFLGRISLNEIRKLLPTYHIFLLLSEYEGLPLALLEAGSAGLVPICTRVQSGVGELVEHQVSGIFVEDRCNSLVAALQRLQTDAAFWTRCSDEIRRRSLSYSLDESGESWLKVLRSVKCRQPHFEASSRAGDRPMPPVMKEFAFDDWERAVAPIRRLLKPVRRLLRRWSESAVGQRAKRLSDTRRVCV